MTAEISYYPQVEVTILRICHIGHGILPIPPMGWGAVESLIWNYKYWLQRSGHECFVINTRERSRVVAQCASLQLDIVHVHCEEFFGIAQTLGAKVCILCSHWPMFFEPERAAQAIKCFQGNCYIACLSERIRSRLIQLGVAPQRLFLAKNGARADLCRFTDKPQSPQKSICLAAIRRRKRQYLIQDIDSIDFVGPRGDPKLAQFDYSRPNYLGEWSKESVYYRLTDYANLVLLSQLEVAPLSTCEALMAGLGVVVSESAAANLDTTLPFVSVIPESRVTDKAFVRQVIEGNRRTSLQMRNQIRSYAVKEFDWGKLIQQYIRNLEQMLGTWTDASSAAKREKS